MHSERGQWIHGVLFCKLLWTHRQLGNVGEADETEILEAETEEQRMEIAAGIAEAKFRREWALLICAVGVPSMPPGGVAGKTRPLRDVHRRLQQRAINRRALPHRNTSAVGARL